MREGSACRIRRQLLLGQLGPHVPRVLLDEPERLRALLGRHVRDRQGPRAWPGFRRGPGPLTMSPSDWAAMTARARCAAVRLWINARRQVLLRGESPQPLLRPDGTWAGLAPRNAGVIATGRPGTSVKLSER